jgi:hypothetical protein
MDPSVTALKGLYMDFRESRMETEICDRVYDEAELQDWLFAQKLKGA